VLAKHDASCCTDVTGFGLLGHLVEMAAASGARVSLSMGAVPLLPGAAETVAAGVFSSLQPANLRLKRAVANEAEALEHPVYPLLFDPQTSGGLLAAVPARRAAACLKALHAIGYEHAAVVGKVTSELPEGTCAPTLVECAP
jgi:selenide,water dikinase